MPANPITIAPNKPLYVALIDTEGRYDFETEKGYYQTTDGRTLELPEPAVIALNKLEAQPGEEVQITRHWSGKHREFPTWTVCLSAKSENARAAAEIPDALTEQLETSLEAIKRGKAPVEPPTPIRRPAKSAPLPSEQPKLFDGGKGTGTYGPAPAIDPMPAPVMAPLTAAALRKEREPIPANVATREILQFIELDPNTKNWCDQAKQDLASTWIIAFMKTRHIGLWERDGK